MTSNQLRIQGKEIYKACQELELVVESEELSYCPQMCTRMSQKGGEISDRAVGQTAGVSSDELQQKVNELEKLLEKYYTRLKKCEQGAKALHAFKLTLEPLETAIKTTFDAWFKANRDLDEAEESLEELQENIENSEETASKLESQLKAATENLDDAKTALTRV